jgi:hypothetical protein
MKNDLEIAYKIYESFIKNKGRRNLKAICFRDVIFPENSNLEITVKLRQTYWGFSAYYLGYKRRLEFNRPNYRDLIDLQNRTESFLTQVNRIRQSNWFWSIPQFIEK